MYISAQTVITAGAVLSALVAFLTLGWKLFKWIAHQKEQDQEIFGIKARHERDIAELRKLHAHDRDGIQEEQTIIVYGLLACLKGLAEKGCDGPVSEAIDKIEKHINKKAHGRE